jgi:hypothetical protein
VKRPIDGNAQRSLLEGDDPKHNLQKQKDKEWHFLCQFFYLLIWNAGRKAGHNGEEEECKEHVQIPSTVFGAKSADHFAWGH